MAKTQIVATKGKKVEVWSGLAKACRNHTDWSYNYLKGVALPHEYKGWRIDRVPINKLSK